MRTRKVYLSGALAPASGQSSAGIVDWVGISRDDDHGVAMIMVMIVFMCAVMTVRGPRTHRRRLRDRTALRSRSAARRVLAASPRAPHRARMRSRLAKTCTGTWRSPRCQASRARCVRSLPRISTSGSGATTTSTKLPSSSSSASPMRSSTGSGSIIPICVPFTPVRCAVWMRRCSASRMTLSIGVALPPAQPTTRTTRRIQLSRAGRSSSASRCGGDRRDRLPAGAAPSRAAASACR